jgi:hypothetical protein
MYCPQCGQERFSEQTNFCSRCGFLLTGVSQLLLTGGELPGVSSAPLKKCDSARSRGLKQGLFIFLLTFLIVPIVAIFTRMFGLMPFPVAITAILLFVGGILRMVYALLFEPTEAAPASLNSQAVAQPRLANPAADRSALPPQQTYPASNYGAPAAGRWRDTSDLEPASVTENTTKLLENEDHLQ